MQTQDLYSKVFDLIHQIDEEIRQSAGIFVTDEEYEDAEDVLYDAPRIQVSRKYGYVSEYAVLEVYKGGELSCGAIDDDYGDFITLRLSDINIDETLAIYKQLKS